MKIPIVYEDEALLVIDKPSGLVVNRAESVKGETLQDWIEKKSEIRNPKSEINDETKDFYNRSGIVHRLDKETSGLLIIAKTPEAFFTLQSQFKERKVVKKYITLVHGEVIPNEGTIKASVGRLPWNRERFGVLAGGREAVTSYKSLKSVKSPKGEILTFLEVTPATGRTHQIRIHLKYLGYSVVADSLYAGRKTYKNDLEFCPRLFLHASYLEFTHPDGGGPIELKSKLPDDLDQVIKKMTYVRA